MLDLAKKTDLHISKGLTNLANVVHTQFTTLDNSHA
jgi:hypothetical protein